MKNDKLKTPITARITALLALNDMKPFRLSQKTGIDNAVIYKCLNGKRKWNLGHLQKIALALGVTPGELLQEETIIIPQVGVVKEGQGPPQSQILRPEPDHRGRPLRLKEYTKKLAKMYDLGVEDRSMMPAFPPGTVLFVQKETSDTIKNENFVVYWGDDGQTYIRQIFLDQDHIVLRSLTQGVPDRILPAKHIALCDKILGVEFPA